MHNAFTGREDAMRRTVELCQEAGIAVTGYYSLIYNTWAHDNHPEWRMLDENGHSKRVERCSKIADMDFSDPRKTARYGFCCPNNPGYRNFVKEQICEMADYFSHVDGMFYDMLFWPHLCYCEHCRARWNATEEGEIPTEADWQDARWLRHMHLRRVWMGEFAQWVTDLTHSLLPGVSVEHNVAYSALGNGTVANCEEVIRACDYAGGDLYRGVGGQSFACKFYREITKNQPFEYMFSRCAPNLSAHTQIKSEDVMKSSAALTAAHHGASLIIDAIDPIGSMDRRVYERIGKVFGSLQCHEPYLTGEMQADVGVYYSLKSKFNADGEPYTNHLGTTTAIGTLVGAHILCGVTGGFADLKKYLCIVASCLTDEDAYDLSRLQEYVREGGNLYFSGGGAHAMLRAFFGVEVVGRTREMVTYLAPKEAHCQSFEGYNTAYPLHFDGTAPLIEGMDDECVLATLTLPFTHQHTDQFASIHSNPPGIATDHPLLACKQYGKGKVLWSAIPIECIDQYDHRRILCRLLADQFVLTPTLASNADEDVEITLFRATDRLILHTVLQNDRHTARRIADYEITLTVNRPIRHIKRIVGDSYVGFSQKAGKLRFTVTKPTIFETFVLQF